MEIEPVNCQAICRDFIPGSEESFRPGDLVVAPLSAFNPRKRPVQKEFFFFLKSDPRLFVKTTPDHFLDFRKYLKRHRIFDVWFLTNKKLFQDHRPCCHIANPATLELGMFPYRFDSRGEIYYFVESNQLDLDDYLIGHWDQLRVLPSLKRLRKLL